MNYTNPQDEDYNDKPEDWLNSALIFSKALSKMLDINEGIVLDLEGDMRDTLPEMWGDEDRVVVFVFLLPWLQVNKQNAQQKKEAFERSPPSQL